MSTVTSVDYSFATSNTSVWVGNRDWDVDWDVDFREVEFDLSQFDNRIVFDNFTVLPYVDEVSFDPLTSSVLFDVNILWQSNSEFDVPPQVVPVSSGIVLLASALMTFAIGAVRKPGNA